MVIINKMAIRFSLCMWFVLQGYSFYNTLEQLELILDYEQNAIKTFKLMLV
jgi:hypothetical protein